MEKKGTAISIWVDHETSDKVGRLAKKLGISKSQLLRNVALCGLDDAEALDKLGMLNVAMMIIKTKEKLSSIIEEGKREIQEA